MAEIKHGTYYAYTKRKCRCEQCKRARRDYMEGLRGRAQPAIEFFACGTVSGYVTYKHRDEACRRAWAEYTAERRKIAKRKKAQDEMERTLRELGLLEVNGSGNPTMIAFHKDHPNATEWDAMDWLESIEAKSGRGWDAFNYSNRAGQEEALKELKRLAE